ncbi:MAG: PSD1 and planctomycete cytochrome C domain-containing protein [Planctomycetaceae bacterium]
MLTVFKTWLVACGWISIALCFCGGVSELLAVPPETDADGVKFFEKQIRPILVEHCYRCHSQQAEKLKGELLLDTREGLRKGGSSGPAIVAGDPDASLLVTAIRHTDNELKMPPNKKLSAGQIADLEAWVRKGAPQPQDARSGAGGPETRTASATAHWAFQPVQRPAIPVVKERGWVQTPIDDFILAALESRGMQPSPQADRRTLIRRATYDLIGLPPTPEEVAAFQADESPGAFACVVDRLLASPQYGERWGRHWLDVARYANSKGDTPGLDAILPFAFTYRDYVIRALNSDLPYDRFVLEQMAADQLDLGDDNRPLAAIGFLTVGRRFLNNNHDTIDDRIDVITRGLMGLTVTCARCHDHKYDPIPTEDYYSLYGVLSSSAEPDELPLLDVSPDPNLYAEYLAKRAQREKNIKAFREEKEDEVQRQLRQQSSEYLLMAWQMRNRSVPDQEGGPTLHPAALRWKDALAKWEQAHHPIFAPWFAFAALPEEEFATAAEPVAATIAANADADHPLNPLVAQAFAGTPPASLKEVSERYGRLFQEVDQHWQALQEGHTYVVLVEWQRNPQPPSALPDPHEEALRQVLYGEDGPGNLPLDQARKLIAPVTRLRLRQLEAELEKLNANHPGSPQRAMVLADNPAPTNTRVFIRGNPNNPGQEVPRQFLGLLAGPERQPFQKGSGRLELAQAIASRDNPLTSRFLVNRVWMHHFGAGLVSTVADFGLRSEPPSHPELLDYLAWRFMDEGWSLKKLHRLLILSSVYQQKSDDALHNQRQDPENRFLSKMNRRRLDFEAMRDTILAVTGNLDSASGARPVDLAPPPILVSPIGSIASRDPPPDKRHFSTLRSIYGFIDRQNLPGLFRTFDFADPDTATVQRTETTIPQQALFFLNSLFVREEARTMLQRPELNQLKRAVPRIQRLYQLIYQRDPRPEEIELGLEFMIAAQAASLSVRSAVDGEALTSNSERLAPWEQYAQVLLMSNELMFVD